MRLPGYVWPLLVLWLALVAVAAVFAPKLDGVVRQEVSDVEGSDSQAAGDLIRAEFGDSRESSILIVFASDTLNVSEPAYRQKVEEVLAEASSVAGVTGTVSYYDSEAPSLLGRDGRSTVATISLTRTTEELLDQALPDLDRRLASLRDGPVSFFITGEAAIARDVRESSTVALRRSERLAIPLVLLTLILIFGSLVAAGIPLLLGGVAVVVTSAVVYFLSSLMTVDNLAPSMISMMGMGVGVDYSLFLVSRFREELGRGHDRIPAMNRTLATSGKAIAFSGVTVIVSVAAAFIVKIAMIRTLALAVVLVILAAVITALTFLPCILLLLGPNVDRLKLPGARRRAAASQGFWRRWALGVMKRPWVYLVLVLVPLVAMALPAARLETGFALLELVPEDGESRLAADVLGRQFEIGLISPIEVVVKVPRGTVVSEENLPKLYALAQDLRQDPEVAQVIGVTSLDPEWTYEDYEATFIDGPRLVAESTADLGQGADGLAQSGAALGQIESGLRAMQTQLATLAQTGGAADLSQLTTGLRQTQTGMAEVQGGLTTLAGSVTSLSGAVGQVRTQVDTVKGNLEAMSPAAKADPHFAAAYQSAVTALAILDGVNPLTGESTGSLAAALQGIGAGLGQSSGALGGIAGGLDQAIAVLQSAAGGGGQPGGAAGAVLQASAGLKQAADGLDRVIAGLGEMETGLRQASGEAQDLDLATLLADSDLPLKLVLSQATATQRESLETLVNTESGSNAAVFKVIARSGPDDLATRDLVTRIRETVGLKAAADGIELHVGGLPAFVTDFNAELTRALPKVMALVLVITFLVLMVLLRSILLPLKAVLMNALSVAASYGLLTLVFQEGHLARFIGVSPLGYIESPIILMLFVALFGLSMDYEVFLLSRVKESYDQSGNNEEAVAEGLEQTAGIITGAAAIMIFVFGAFVFAGLVAMKEFGFGLAVAVALDATLIRIILAPAFMRLMGQWNWWAPRWLKNILPRVGIGE
jgi:RND superfamily putative drug exporter